MMEICIDCHYWDRAEGLDVGKERMGLCRINPPVIIDNGISRHFENGSWKTYSKESIASWPITESHDWCGKWQINRWG